MQGTPTSVAMTDGTDRVAPEHWQPRGVTPVEGARERQRGWQLLGQVLVKRGLLSQEQLAAAFERQRRGAQRLGRVLVDLNMISETALLECLAQQFNKLLMSEEELASLEPEVVRILPEETARLNMVVAVERSARQLVVATADPLNVLALDEVRRVTGLDVDFRIAPAAAIQTAIQRHYRGSSTERDDETVRQELGLTVLSGNGAEDTVDLKQLRTQADDPPVVKLVNYMLTRSACDGASDIHVEPFEDRTIIRYRIDGLLYDLLEGPGARGHAGRKGADRHDRADRERQADPPAHRPKGHEVDTEEHRDGRESGRVPAARGASRTGDERDRVPLPVVPRLHLGKGSRG